MITIIGRLVPSTIVVKTAETRKAHNSQRIAARNVTAIKNNPRPVAAAAAHNDMFSGFDTAETQAAAGVCSIIKSLVISSQIGPGHLDIIQAKAVQIITSTTSFVSRRNTQVRMECMRAPLT